MYNTHPPLSFPIDFPTPMLNSLPNPLVLQNAHSLHLPQRKKVLFSVRNANLQKESHGSEYDCQDNSNRPSRAARRTRKLRRRRSGSR